MANRIEHPYTVAAINVTSALEQTYILDLGSLPIRLSVESMCAGTADTKIYTGNDESGFKQYGSTITSYPSLIQMPTPTYRFIKVVVTPTGSQAILVTISSKL